MKLIQVASTLLLAASAMAQQIGILNPTSGEALAIGQSFNVRVGQGDQLTGLTNVALVIGMQRCGSNPCSSAQDNQILGQVLYTGDYTPKRHEGDLPPYQDFSFDLPSSEQPQHATIYASHFYLLGAGETPTLETKNVSVTIGGAASAKFRRVGL